MNKIHLIWLLNNLREIKTFDNYHKNILNEQIDNIIYKLNAEKVINDNKH
jgi:hypothetical protein|tara:strand:+ start:5711 stop:5860 length:150 start_codon:yes stop_codon:yes gene_type:complete